MFYYIQGTIALLEPTFAVVDVGGVGYKLTVSGTTHERLSQAKTDRTRLYTYMAVREDDIELFGFSTEEELSAFRMLISVSGVGPKAAMAILTIMTPEKFALAVCTGDSKAIAKANGVGAKTAARVILELQDKMLKDTDNDTLVAANTATVGTSMKKGALSEALDALMVLGYSRAESTSALQGIDPSLDSGEMIKIALKKLMRNI
ncbi:MAG: Holliday junction branch migration protein RuvA [Clostridia bacterium]|nr:Holliday junction branch migration protein RuvA [Clostridia bacterium]